MASLRSGQKSKVRDLDEEGLYNINIPTQQGDLALNVQDDEGELWIYDPRNPDHTYAVVYYGSRTGVARMIADHAPKLAREVRRAGAKKVAYWTSLEVQADARKKGLGRAFVRHVLAELQERGVEFVVLLAHNSDGFWCRMGFEYIEGGEWFMPAMALRLARREAVR